MAESADRVAIAFDPAQIRKAQDRNPFVKISDIVYDILSEAILSSTIAPGSKLNISSIAENLNISHTPVFQAVDRLKNSGLIVESNETSKYHSYRVLDISNESLTNLFTARKAIETTAASICATNVALIDIAQLKKMAAEFRTVWSLYANGRGTSADFADRETLDRAFHIHMNKISFEDTEMQDDGEQISTYGMSYECQDLQSVANDESYPLEERDEAAEQLEQLAEDGDAYAQYIIGTAYRDGGLLIPDMAKAKKFLERAAEQEIDAAQYALGKLYLSDDADVHDPAKGIYWLKRSADNGNDYAAYRLGKEYLSGKNVSKDTSTAAEYLRQAADNGSAYAQYLLGKLTLMGEGIPKDMDAAYEWFAAARDNGHAYAEFFLKRMERGEQEPPSVLLSATRLLYHMGNIFRDNAPVPAATGVQIDRKRLAQLRQKRVALGHKPDDHEPEQQQGFSMKFHM